MSREGEIVEVFQRLASMGRLFTADELNQQWKPAAYRGTQDSGDLGRLATVRRVLRTIEALGLITRTPEGAFLSTTPQQAQAEYAAYSKTDTGEAPPAGPPSQGGDGGGGGQAGDGFRQVLSHPHLFVLPSSDFERLLETI